MVRERPLLMRPELVRQTLAGLKTETRRVVRPQPVETLPEEKRMPGSRDEDPWFIVRARGWRWQRPGDDRITWAVSDRFAEVLADRCPYGRPGDRLWVRETWARAGFGGGFVYRADLSPEEQKDERWVQANATELCRAYAEHRWRPAIHMPRAACRLVLEVTSIRAERLHELTEDAARREGVEAGGGSARAAFVSLWDAINAAPRKRKNGEPGPAFPWSSNPWVWVVSYKPLAKGQP